MNKFELKFHESRMKQGDIVSADYNVDGMDISSLEGQTIAETLYIHKFSENEVKVIFVKVPETNEISDKEMIVTWNPVMIEATQASEKLIFGTFEVPKRNDLIIWCSLGLLVLGVLVFVGRRLSQKSRAKREHKEKLRSLKNQLLDATDYDAVVAVWKNKTKYFETFPHVKEAFENFELVLNKYQFKSSRSQAELVEIMQAYREFRNSIEGGFYGI